MRLKKLAQEQADGKDTALVKRPMHLTQGINRVVTAVCRRRPSLWLWLMMLILLRSSYTCLLFAVRWVSLTASSRARPDLELLSAGRSALLCALMMLKELTRLS